ncbi:hypothetical protein [Anaerotruncus colihominis]|uniref:hypothetical protein n=1 Tax=Anaerotruncus colihominis TaxID=169435 RepID=UPI003994381D
MKKGLMTGAVCLMMLVLTMLPVAAQDTADNWRGRFVDENGDGVCDYAGEYCGYGRFVDEDGDGICDYAGKGSGCGGRAAIGGGCGRRGRFN